MKRVIVTYKIKPDRIAENVAHIERVFAELAQTKPAGLHYASFRTPEGRFFHLAVYEGNPLPEQPAFRAFLEGLRERCEEPPAPVDLTEVGSHGMFGL